MRLDFNVLWVDDQPNRVEAQITNIGRQMGGQGFEFKPVLCKTLDEVSVQLGDEVFDDEVDLILVDLNLGDGVYGQDVIGTIRERIPYKDVVLYSATADVNELRRLAFDKGLEGIYFSDREGLVDEVVGVFDSLIKKVLDLDHTRGIVMGATSDIEFMIRESLAAAHDLLDDGGKKAMVQSAIERIESKLKSFSTKLKKLKDSQGIKLILESHVIFTANDGLLILSELLETSRLREKHGQYKVSVDSYRKEVQDDRNRLGHQVLTPQGKPKSVVDHAGNEVGLDDMRDLRRRLLDLRREFRELHAALRT